MNKSFTLIEILVVIVVIGVLSAFILVGMSSITSKANIAKGIAFSNSLRNTLLINLALEWKLDETGVDTTSKDSWKANSGTLSGFVFTEPNSGWRTGSQCVKGGCLQFDGTDDYIQYLNLSDSQINGAITVELWLYRKATAGNVIPISRGTYNTSGSWYFHVTGASGNSFLRIMDIGYTGPTISQDKWDHIVWTHDGNNGNGILKFYKNGIYDSSAGSSTAITPTGTPTDGPILGRYHGGNYWFNGFIDEVRIYNSFISISQIQENYYSGVNNLFISNNINKGGYTQRIVELRNNLAKD
jgi:prepilin-type N-terminal cleavage/methylation domain-containing protein